MSCTFLDRDQAFIVQDYGPAGSVAPISVNLTYGLKPGAVLSAVAKSDHEIALHVKDAAGNHLITIGFRLYKDEFIMNSYLDHVWGVEERPGKNPVSGGARAAITLLYEAEGYKLVVNGKQFTFFKHRSTAPAKTFEIHGSQVFKVVYLTTVDIIP